MRARRHRRGTALAAATVLLVACGSGRDRTPGAAQATPTPIAVLAVRDVAAVERFWRDELPDRFGVDVDPITSVVPYRVADEVPLPRCNGTPLDPDAAADNAVYCRAEHLIAYDVDAMEHLRLDHGDLAVAVVLAHEYGHAVQATAGQRGDRLGLELQADCFAGAWAATTEPTDADLDGAIGALVGAADRGRSIAAGPAGHGGPFDRTAAFAEGVSRGTSACTTDDADRPGVDADASSGTPVWNGSIEVLAGGLDSFSRAWRTGPTLAVEAIDDGETAPCPADREGDGDAEGGGDTGAQSPAICTDHGTVRYDDGRLRGPVGRWSVGYPVAAAHLRALLAPDDPRPRPATPALALAADCALGAFVATTAATPVAGVRTDAQDLDEIVEAMASPEVVDATPATSTDRPSVLDRVEALRTGVRQGLDGCDLAPPR